MQEHTEMARYIVTRSLWLCTVCPEAWGAPLCAQKRTLAPALGDTAQYSFVTSDKVLWRHPLLPHSLAALAGSSRVF